MHSGYYYCKQHAAKQACGLSVYSMLSKSMFANSWQQQQSQCYAACVCACCTTSALLIFPGCSQHTLCHPCSV